MASGLEERWEELEVEELEIVIKLYYMRKIHFKGKNPIYFLLNQKY